MQVKPGYKQTEVGVIPDEWQVTRLREITHIATGNTPPTRDAANYGDEFLFVSPVDLGEAKYVTTTEKRLSKKGFAISRRFPKNAILFVCIGSTIGKCGVAPVELTANQQINAIFPSPAFSVDYLYYFICCVAPKIKALAGEQAVPIVNKTQFSETVVALPPLAEQRAIAGALGDVDALLGALEKLIAKKRDLKQAAMQQLLTGQKRLPGFTSEWEVRALGDRIALLSGHHVLAQHCNRRGDGVPYLTGPADFPNGKIHHTKFTERPTTLCASDDILVTVKGSGSGSLVVSDAVYCISRQLMAIRVRDWNGRFIYYSLLQNASQIKAASAGLIPGLSRSDILDQPLPVPPSTDEQTAIAEVLSDMDAEIAALEQRLAKSRALKQGMMQELLTGKTRLV